MNDRFFVPESLTLQSSDATTETRVTVTIPLSEKGNLLGLKTGSGRKRIDHRCGLLSVAGAEVDDVAVRRVVTQYAGARKRSEKQRFLFVNYRNGGDRRRSPNVTDDGKNIFLVDQFPHIERSTSGFITIVEHDEPQFAPLDTAGAVGAVQTGQNPQTHLLSQVRCWAG